MTHVPRLIREIVVICFISSMVGILAQTVLPNGIALKTNITVIGADSSAVSIPTIMLNPENDDGAASNIVLAEAYSAFRQGSALFLDARSHDDFQSGHIEGAINLPAHAFMDSLTFLDELNLDQPLITYCDGADCNASIDLAAGLKMMGFTQVYFFFGGWKEWVTAKYPVNSEL